MAELVSMAREFENYNGQKLYTLTINDERYKFNQNPDLLNKLYSFSDILPSYDAGTKNFYLSLNDRTGSGNKTDVIISKCVIGRTNVPSTYDGIDTSGISENEYWDIVCRIKREHITSLVKNIYAYGFERPSIAQSMGIVPLINGKDAIVQFQSGTGKTATFLLGLLWGYDGSNPSLQYLFLTSTHEVADQIHTLITKFLPNAKTCLCIGGNKSQAGGFKNNQRNVNDNIRNQIRSAQIIVGTVGKTYELMCVKKFIPSMGEVKAICLDEFDQLLSSQKSKSSSHETRTEDQIKSIFSEIPKYAQRVFFSATVIPGADEQALQYFREYDDDYGDPFLVLLHQDNVLLKGIRHYYVSLEHQEKKLPVLMDLLARVRIQQCIIFVNKIETAYRLHGFLESEKVQCVLFHGGLDGDTRMKITEKFRAGEFRFMIATDVMSRGIDIQTINVIINFDMPNEKDTYIHRIGRSGRFGRKGVAINFILLNRDIDEMQKVYDINNCSDTNKMVPLPAEVADLL